MGWTEDAFIVAVITFVDSDGTNWEVFQVRRTSTKEGAVSAGREGGWLAFTSGVERRRFAPVPSDWDTLPPATLETMCRAARPVMPRRAQSWSELQLVPGQRPGARRSAEAAPSLDRIAEPGTSPTSPRSSPSSASFTSSSSALPAELADIATAHGRAARKGGETAVTALLRLRAVLATLGVPPASETFRHARRAFLDAYYFESRELGSASLDASRR